MFLCYGEWMHSRVDVSRSQTTQVFKASSSAFAPGNGDSPVLAAPALQPLSPPTDPCVRCSYGALAAGKLLCGGGEHGCPPRAERAAGGPCHASSSLPVCLPAEPGTPRPGSEQGAGLLPRQSVLQQACFREKRCARQRRILWMLPKRKTFKALPTLTSLTNSHP